MIPSGLANAESFPTPGDDVITGTEGFDDIDSGDGDDVIFGLGGDDKLRGGDGSDEIFGVRFTVPAKISTPVEIIISFSHVEPAPCPPTIMSFPSYSFLVSPG